MRDKRNYLDFVPVKNPQLPWQEDEGGIVTVEVTHRGIAAKVAQVAFNRPKVSQIHMDSEVLSGKKLTENRTSMRSDRK